MKKIFCMLTVLAILAVSAKVWAEEVVLMPKHGSLWRLTEQCGQPGSAWRELAARNPWIKVKTVKGQPVSIVHAGQPILLPDSWAAAMGEEDEDEVVGGAVSALWADFCDMGKNYPIPCAIIALLFFAMIKAKGRAWDKERR